MTFITVGTVSFLVWAVLGKVRLLSVSFANFAGTLIFVALGLQFDPYENAPLTILIGIGFYLFLALGEIAARYTPIDRRRYHRLGRLLAGSRRSRAVLSAGFIIFGLLPLVQFLVSGQSLADRALGTWAANTTVETSRKLIERAYGSVTGLEALLAGVQSQLLGFWYLSFGVVVHRKRRFLYPVLAAYAAGVFLMSEGSRSAIMVSLSIPVLIFLLSAEKTRRLRTIVVFGVLGVGILLSMDYLRTGRQGLEVQGSLQDRLERTLRADFAYGGLGLNLGLNNPPESMAQGIGYLMRTAVLPIPRVLWPAKPTSSPNQEMTERATGFSLAMYGSILLFTPLGEALIYFGYAGIVVIPFLYGFTTVLLGRLCLTSTVYVGLLAQVYIWSFLCMRLTFFNLFSVLIAGNFSLLCVLFLGAHLIPKRRVRRRGPGQDDGE
jgi:hypothetical protein